MPAVSGLDGVEGQGDEREGISFGVEGVLSLLSLIFVVVECELTSFGSQCIKLL